MASSIHMAFCLLFFSFQFSSSFAQTLPSDSSISAAPALLPIITPSSPMASPSPASSPDITPLFPSSPSGTQLSPTESSLPTIPSSPSPPNPDDMATYGPNTMSISPTASLPASSSVSWNPATSLVITMVAGSLMAFWSSHLPI